MQIERITSNRPKVFVPIAFNAGDEARTLNVVFGDVQRPKDGRTDSHNLGKTLLIDVIDFLFLSSVDKNHLFVRHCERFEGMVLFMELRLGPSEFVGIRRSIDEPSRIDLVRADTSLGDRVHEPDLSWTHTGVAFDRARELLDGWFAFSTLGGYGYRKAITYFLRSQRDWSDELQLQKFSAGADRDWKPFVGQLFGYDHEKLRRKYDLDVEIERLTAERVRRANRVDAKEADLPTLRAELAVLTKSLDDLDARLDAFQFDEAERAVIHDLVEKVETRITELNQKAYNARYDAAQIRVTLGRKDKFDTDVVRRVFEEAQLVFPNQLRRDYEALVSFRKRITSERRAALRKQLQKIERELEEVMEEQRRLDEERRRRLVVVDSTDTVEKYKSLQREHRAARRRYDHKAEDVQRLEELVKTSRSLRDRERTRAALIDEITEMTDASTTRIERFQGFFDGYCRDVVGLEGIFSFTVNKSGNLDYEIGLGLREQRGQTSDQGRGTSYQKLLCALFDLALLRTYRDERFFRFVYHDGVLEGLDPRRKRAFLSLVRDEIGSGSLQYILTSISEDLPTDEEGAPIPFSEDEIVLSLDDTGDRGRLFRGPAF